MVHGGKIIYIYDYIKEIFAAPNIFAQLQFIDALKLKAPWNLYWMSNMFLSVEIFLFFECYHVVAKRHSQLNYELNDL